jgi:predicted DsbA family dithiol-disulfide isomerase
MACCFGPYGDTVSDSKDQGNLGWSICKRFKLERVFVIPLTIEVFVDPICPWCFIGKRHLDRALAQVGGTVAIAWRAFQLNPGMPEGGMDRSQYLAGKFGGIERARQVYDVIRREGEAEDIPFAFAKITRTPNTLKAHRLIRLAGRSNQAEAVMDGLFRAYFLEGRDIGKGEELARVAGDAGLDASAAAGFLAGDMEREAVQQEDLAARASGIGGVPHAIVAGRYALPGAQSPEVIARTIELARAGTGARV